MKASPLGIYIHIPFCRSKCAYCAFDSYRYNRERMEAYLSALATEIEQVGRRDTAGPVTSVFFGGGTPSLLHADQVRSLLCSLNAAGFHLDDAEITIEANPGTVAAPLLEGFREAGINRISFGAEVFDDSVLASLGRIHSGEEVGAAVGWARRAGFDNLNLDVIYGLPGQTPESWIETLGAAVALSPDHLSAYALQLEEGTRISHDAAAGRVTLPSEEEVLAMEDSGIRLLRKEGYERYEISNYARAGKACRHNLLYWRHENVLGLGSGAHSLIQDQHITNVRRPEEYTERIRRGASPADRREVLDPAACAREAVAFGVRLAEGVDLEAIEARYDVLIREDLEPALVRLQRDGLVARRESRLALTPLGYRFADRVGMALV